MGIAAHLANGFSPPAARRRHLQIVTSATKSAPSTGLQPSFQFPEQEAESGLKKGAFFSLGAHMSRHMSRTTLQAARGGVHMHICIGLA